MLGATWSHRDLIFLRMCPELVEGQSPVHAPLGLSKGNGPWASTSLAHNSSLGRSSPRSGGEEHGKRSSVGVDLGINAHLADQLRHGSVDVRLNPGGTMVQAEVRQTRQEDTT